MAPSYRRRAHAEAFGVYPCLTYRDVRGGDHLAAESIRSSRPGARPPGTVDSFGLERQVFGEAGTGRIDHVARARGQGVVLVESKRSVDLHGSHTGRGWVYIAPA